MSKNPSISQFYLLPGIVFMLERNNNIFVFYSTASVTTPEILSADDSVNKIETIQESFSESPIELPPQSPVLFDQVPPEDNTSDPHIL